MTTNTRRRSKRVKIPGPTFRHRADECFQQSRIGGQPGLSDLGRFQRAQACRRTLWRKPAAVGNRAGSVWPAIAGCKDRAATCRLISPADSPTGQTESIRACCVCRIATARMDWNNTSIVAGQDDAFISPLSPTSFASLSVPAFSYAGNLWGWIPQVRVEHRFYLSEGQNVPIQGGIWTMSPGNCPRRHRTHRAGRREFGTTSLRKLGSPGLAAFSASADSGHGGLLQPPDLGLRSPRGRLGGNDGLDRSAGASGQPYGRFYRGPRLEAWVADWAERAFQRRSRSSTQICAQLDSVGGWSQVKLRVTDKLEFNGAFGMDNAYAADLRGFP